MTIPMFLENRTKYRIRYKWGNGQIEEFDCWRYCDKWITDSFTELKEENVELIARLGTIEEL